MERTEFEIAVDANKRDKELLDVIETQLISMIAESGNEPLQDKFLEWMQQRSNCNQTYQQIFDIIIKAKID